VPVGGSRSGKTLRHGRAATDRRARCNDDADRPSNFESLGRDRFATVEARGTVKYEDAAFFEAVTFEERVDALLHVVNCSGRPAASPTSMLAGKTRTEVRGR